MDSISLEIPDETTNTKTEVLRNIQNFESFQQNPILTCSPSRKINIVDDLNKKEPNIISFNENLSKMFQQEINIQSNEEKFQQPCQINKTKKQLILKDSLENKENFEKFFNEATENVDPNQRFLLRTKTPEFAKFFKNNGKHQNFFKIEKPNDQLEIPPHILTCSKDSKVFDTSEFSEKKEQNFNGNWQSKRMMINRIETLTKEEKNDQNKKLINRIETQTQEEQNDVVLFFNEYFKFCLDFIHDRFK